uniref:Protein quiver n=1 Tax=Macrostomum lignano TaxID=282301 RepID=A0A1I8HE29_9PLAT
MHAAWGVQLPVLLLLLGSLIPLGTGDEADFSDHITCYECEGQLGNSTCSTPGVDIDKVLNQVSCVRGGCLKWAYYKNSQLQLVRTCSLRVNMSIYLHSACRQERRGNGFICICPNDLCNSAAMTTALPAAALAAQLLLLLLLEKLF